MRAVVILEDMSLNEMSPASYGNSKQNNFIVEQTLILQQKNHTILHIGPIGIYTP